LNLDKYYINERRPYTFLSAPQNKFLALVASFKKIY